MSRWKAGALLPLLGLAGALAVAAWLAWSLFGRSASLGFSVVPGADYEAIVLTDGPEPREVYRAYVRDQDAGDRDPRAGRYRLRVPNPLGLSLKVRPRPVVENRAQAPAAGEPQALPAGLPGTPFAGEVPRQWVPLVGIGELVPTFQHPSPGSGPPRGRAVDLSDDGGERVLTPECDVTQIDVDETGSRALLVREQPPRLEIWHREEEGAWRRAAALAEPGRLAGRARWDGGQVWFVGTRGTETALWRWDPAAADPRRQTVLPSVYRLLTVRAGQVWLEGPREGEFLRYAPGAGLQPFVADPDLGAALLTYRGEQDAFYYLVPARDRRGQRLLRRGRLDRRPELLRILPEEVVAVSLSGGGRTLLGVLRCR